MPNFHVIGFTNNFVFNLFAGIRCAVHHDADSQALTPRLILQAVAELKPTVVDTVPWLAEEMLLRLDKGDPAAAPLKDLKYILAGGAALNEELLLPVLLCVSTPLQPRGPLRSTLLPLRGADRLAFASRVVQTPQCAPVASLWSDRARWACAHRRSSR